AGLEARDERAVDLVHRGPAGVVLAQRGPEALLRAAKGLVLAQAGAVVRVGVAADHRAREVAALHGASSAARGAGATSRAGGASGGWAGLLIRAACGASHQRQRAT